MSAAGRAGTRLWSDKLGNTGTSPSIPTNIKQYNLGMLDT
jgi:hypothetical protein